jgi:hypothetical protein
MREGYAGRDTLLAQPAIAFSLLARRCLFRTAHILQLVGDEHALFHAANNRREQFTRTSTGRADGLIAIGTSASAVVASSVADPF